LPVDDVRRMAVPDSACVFRMMRRPDKHRAIRQFFRIKHD